MNPFSDFSSLPPLSSQRILLFTADRALLPREGWQAFWLSRISPEERARMERFRFPGLREDFLFSRGLLRTLLGFYADRAPESLRFGRGARGKPFLLPPGGPAFNLSHSASHAVLALCGKGPIGADLEVYGKAGARPDDWAGFCLSPEERASYDALPPVRREERLIRIWTLKEAYLKALGTGLDGSLQDWGFSFSREGEPCFSAPEGEDAEGWRFVLTGEKKGFSLAAAWREEAGEPREAELFRLCPREGGFFWRREDHSLKISFGGSQPSMF